MDLVLSQEQKLFIEKALEGNNILVDACIGSGKTTSIQYLCQQYPKTQTILYLTYNRLLKVDAKTKIKGKNITVTNYHGFALMMLKKAGISCGITDLIQTFIREKPDIPLYDVLIIDEYQDIDLELSNLLEIIKATNPSMQIIAVGDMEQKIYDKTTLDVVPFIDQFLGNHICLTFTQCFRLNKDHAEMLGRIWGKKIVGVNDNCRIQEMTVSEVVPFIADQQPEDILCLGARTQDLARVLNELESSYPDKFNKKTVYASISDSDDGRAVEPKRNSAIFTTYDSSKGLERRFCIIFDFNETYWTIRVKMPQQSYTILRNIFCVAASRGKEQIIFVNNGGERLSEKSISTPVDDLKQLRLVDFSEMFDFKYKESVEKCYSLLNKNRLTPKDNSVIDIKTHDDLIDLSPCIGIYQEASFFEKYDIDKAIELYLKLHNYYAYRYTEEVKNAPVEQKVLFYTSLETKQMRYVDQVSLPFITKAETELLHKRLSSVFSRDDNSQVPCIKEFGDIPGRSFIAKGYADVVKNDIVYELKFVSELTHEHFLQCASYVIALGLKKGILWNTRTNEMWEITVPDEKAFCLEVSKTVLKLDIKKDILPLRRTASKNVFSDPADALLKNDPAETKLLKKNTNYFAVIDTETTWTDKVMSIGLCIVEKESYNHLVENYYIIMPEALEPGMYSSALRSKKCPVMPIECSRSMALNNIKSLLETYGITDVFAYNAPFDCNHLPEMNYVSWYDIMRIAAYKQFNTNLPSDADYFKTGKLKRNYGVEPMFRLLSRNGRYTESHNAARDAIDEANLMKMLIVPYQVYIKNALVKCAKQNQLSEIAPKDALLSGHSVNSIDFTDEKIKSNDGPIVYSTEHRDRTIFEDEATMLLGIGKKRLRKLIKNGEIDGQLIGNKYYISLDSVLLYQEKRENSIKYVLIAAAILIGSILLILSIIFAQ